QVLPRQARGRGHGRNPLDERGVPSLRCGYLPLHRLCRPVGARARLRAADAGERAQAFLASLHLRLPAPGRGQGPRMVAPAGFRQARGRARGPHFHPRPRQGEGGRTGRRGRVFLLCPGGRAMSETGTRDAIARAFAAFNASDLDGLTSCFTEDVAHDMPGGGREIGRDRLRWRLAEMARHFRAEAADIAIMTAPGGFRAAAEFTLRGTYLATLEGFPAARGQAFR